MPTVNKVSEMKRLNQMTAEFFQKTLRIEETIQPTKSSMPTVNKVSEINRLKRMTAEFFQKTSRIVRHSKKRRNCPINELKHANS
jgi:hypothetical protein